MAKQTRDINYFYPNSDTTGYSNILSNKRFSVLKQLDFKSILDVGSGCCNLHKWLILNNIDCVYEATDIRMDALSLCNCKIHTEIPLDGKYDLVCLFGTVTYNINENKQENKNILKQLLDKSYQVSNNNIVVTIIKEESLSGLGKLQLVGYTKAEAKKLADAYGSFILDEDSDPNEYILIINVNKNA